MIRNVLFVCIGNICRSPMAEGLFKQALPGREVCSAGIHAMVGSPADPIAVKLMREQGVDIGEHRAQALASWMIGEADLILTMDKVQKNFIERKYPQSKGRVWRLGEYGNFDIPDPYCHGEAAFRHAYSLIAHGVEELTERLADMSSVENRKHIEFMTIRASPSPIST